jgi:hypothetical protein
VSKAELSSATNLDLGTLPVDVSNTLDMALDLVCALCKKRCLLPFIKDSRMHVVPCFPDALLSVEVEIDTDPWGG